MKKSQRARLATLTAQTTHTDAEKVELTELQALAAQHPDASKDIEDAAPAASAPATLGSVLATAMQSLRSKNSVAADLVTARAQVTTLTGERDTARADLATANSQLTTLNGQVTTLNAQLVAFASFFGMDVAAFAGQSAAQVHALLAAKVSAGVTDQVSTFGFPAEKLPAATTTTTQSASELLTQYNALIAEGKPKEAGEFYAANSARMFAAK